MTDEVKDEFIRMKDYLVSEGFGSIKAIYISTNRSSGRLFFDEFISLKGGEFKKLEFSIFPNYR